MEYWPPVQLLQAASPDATLYLPAAHSEQREPSAPVAPGLQVQSPSDVLPSGELEYIEQFTVESDATTVAYTSVYMRMWMRILI